MPPDGDCYALADNGVADGFVGAPDAIFHIDIIGV
jgi:hypothetical protein